MGAAAKKNDPAESEPTTTNPADGSSEARGFDQPLSDPEVLDGEPEDPAASVDGTAALGVKLMDMGCTIRFQAPLTSKEGDDLHRDLAAVLVKYDAPDFPWMEEMNLVANVGGIVFRRAASEHAQRAQQLSQQPAEAPPEPPKPSGVASDMSRPGQEGFRQNGTGAQAGSARPSGEAGDLLS